MTHGLRFAICVVLLSASAATQAAESGDAKKGVDTSIAELISTPRRSSTDRKSVCIRGTISVVSGMVGNKVVNEGDKSFCLEDDTGGIWVRVKQAMDEGLLEDPSVLTQLRAGITAEIEGSLNPGGFAPVILPRRITVLGPGKLSPPIRPDLKDLFRGAYIMRRIAVGGVVQNVVDDSPGWLARVETGAGHFLTRIPKTNELTPETLMDAEIQLVGVAGASRNWRSQFICPRVMIAGAEDVEISRAPSADPFQAEQVRIDELDGFSVNGRSLHRRRLSGAVTYYDGERTMYLLSDDVGLRIELNRPATEELRVGDCVEVAGFIDSTRYMRGLRGAVVHPTGEQASVEPVSATVREIIDDHFTVPTWKQVLTKTFDGRVVSMRGEVLGFDSATERSTTRIEVASGEATFTASMHGPLDELLPGTIVDLTGIATISYASSDSTSLLAAPKRVDLLLRSSGDIRVIQQPSWWTVQRITGALALAIFVASLAVIWGVTLNRRVANQTEQLASEMRSRRDAAIEFQAAIRERTQLAANIHDTVLQTLAGIGCQLDACSQSTQSGGEENIYIKTASRMVQGGQEDLRNIVSALHCLPSLDQTFGESVRGVVRRLQRTGATVRDASPTRNGEDVSRLGTPADGQPQIVVNCDPDLPKLADFIAGNLLLIIQEATRNAVKHAAANVVTITVKPFDNRSTVLISVVDDGRGFELRTRPRVSEGHFGLETMKGRAERIGGVLTIETKPGEGTRIVASAPLRSFDEAIT